MAVGDDDIIDEAVVAIRPDLKDFDKLQARVDAATKGVKAKIKLVADRSGFGASIKAKVAEQQALKNNPTFKIKLVADRTGFATSLRAALAKQKQPRVKVKVDADGKPAEDATRDTLRRIENAERQSYRRRRGAADEFNRSLRSALGDGRLIDFGGRGIRPLNLLYAGLAALSPLLVSVASSAVEASFAFTALGTAGIGAATAITGLVVGFQSVTEALKLRQTVNKQALATAAKDTTGAVLDATDRLTDATNALRRSQRDELEAQLAINDARKDAVRDLENLRQAVRDLQNQERSDKLSVAESKAKADEVGRNFFASSLEKARATQDYRDATTRLSDTQLERKQKRQDLAESLTKGIEGSDTVKAAKKRADDARDARKQDQRQLANARRDLTAARKGGVDAVTSSTADLEQRLKDMSPAAREMYDWFVKNEGILKGYRRTIEQGVLPGFTRFLQAVNDSSNGKQSSLQIFADAAGRLGGIIGTLAGDLGEMTKTSWFRKDFATIVQANADAMDDFSETAKVLLKPVSTILRAASPLLTRFSGYVLKLAERFADFIEEADKSGKLNMFFSDAGDELGRWWELAKQIGRTLKNIYDATNPSGETLVTRLTKFFSDSADWIKNHEKGIRDFFDKVANLPFGKIITTVTQMTALFLTLHAVKWAVMNPFWTALGAFAASNPEGANKLLQYLTTFVSSTVKLLIDHPNWAAGLLAVIAAFKGRKALSLVFKLPVLTSLKDLLAKRFAGLDKLLGGTTSTGTMTVHAGVVNILGGGGATPGRPGAPGAPAGAGKGGVKAAAGGLAASIGLGVGAYFSSQIKTDGMSEFQRGLVNGLTGALTGASLLAAFGPLGIAVGAGIGAAVGLVVTAATAPPKSITDREAQTFNSLRADASFIEKYRTSPGADPSKVEILRDPSKIKTRQSVVDYIAARKASQQADYEYQVKKIGKPLADRRLVDENEKSIAVLSTFLQQLGLGKTEADDFARSQFKLSGEYDKMTPKIKTTDEAIQNANTSIYNANVRAKNLKETLGKLGIKSDTTRVQVDNLKLSVDKLTGEKKITLTVNGEKKVFDNLSTALTYQYALNTGSSLAEARDWINSQNRQRQRSDDKQNIGAATGGYILGRGTATSDSIPARLSRGEFVHRQKAVSYYGPQAMHALNKMQIPRENLYAAGGMVDSSRIPINVDMSKTLIPPVMMPGVAPFTGDSNLAETAERVARAMGATQKQLIALMEAGLVESGMRNINYGDRDSVGFLQQRPSQGWGTVKQLMNPEYATRKFIEAARRVKSQDSMTAGELAQAVQRSAFPDRYGKREAEAIGLINARAPFLPGYSGIVPPGGATPGTWQGMWALIHSVFPKAELLSDYRPGSRTLNGNLSRHALGKAIDVSPWRSIADYIWNNFGSSTFELITPFTDRMIYKGKFHKYSREIEAQHGVYGNNAHVHWSSYADGGLVPTRTYDSGGSLPPGYTLAYNGTGRTETVRTHQQEKALNHGGTVRLDKRDLRELARIIAAATPAVNMDGRKVAEVTNKYTYLPAGV